MSTACSRTLAGSSLIRDDAFYLMRGGILRPAPHHKRDPSLIPGGYWAVLVRQVQESATSDTSMKSESSTAGRCYADPPRRPVCQSLPSRAKARTYPSQERLTESTGNPPAVEIWLMMAAEPGLAKALIPVSTDTSCPDGAEGVLPDDSIVPPTSRHLHQDQVHRRVREERGVRVA